MYQIENKARQKPKIPILSFSFISYENKRLKGEMYAIYEVKHQLESLHVHHS